jgi:predicted DNA-binding protein (MmcQ/YjbR family)
MDWAQVPEDVEANLRKICLALPETHEEQAWNGRKWCIRKRNFAQVFNVDDGTATKVIVMFRSDPPEFDALLHSGHPFFKPGWGHNVMCMVIDDDVDWGEVAELLADSYCIQAPKKLAARVNGAPD